MLLPGIEPLFPVFNHWLSNYSVHAALAAGSGTGVLGNNGQKKGSIVYLCQYLSWNLGHECIMHCVYCAVHKALCVLCSGP